MRKTTLTLLLVTLSFIIGHRANAQVKTRTFHESLPSSFTRLQQDATVIRLAPPDDFIQRKSAFLQKKRVSNDRENQFALSLPVKIDVLEESNKKTQGGPGIYSVTLKAEGALNISVEFSEFELAPGDILSIFTHRELTDSITASLNTENKIWASRVYQGDELHFVLKTNSRSTLSKLRLGKVNFGYKPFSYDFGNIGASADCHINVACPEGNGWDNERNSVALIVINGTEMGTGALVMNTCSTNIPYFLTANHIVELFNGNVTNWVFQFQTWSTACGVDAGWEEDVQFNGSMLRARDAGSDFALLQLNQTPAANSGIHYSGWSRNTNNITSTTVLHHPAGDLMKVSRDNNAPGQALYQGAQCWQLDLDLGRLEGGSSGAPYYNQNHQVVGQHVGRPQGPFLPVCDITVTMGGRFDISWTGGGTPATRLSDWLDPSNSGAMTTNTTNVSALFPPQALPVSINGDDIVCSGNNYTFTISGAPAGTTAVWLPNSYYQITGSGTSAQLSPHSYAHGLTNVSATVTFPNCTTGFPSTPVYVGKSFAGYTIDGYPYPEPNCYEVWGIYSFQANQVSGYSQGITGYQWGYRYMGNEILSPYSSPYYTFIPEQSGVYDIFVKATNDCGVGLVESVKTVTVYDACGFGRFTITAFPNPASDLVYLKVSDNDNTAKTQQAKNRIIIELYDGSVYHKLKVWQFDTRQNVYALNVAGLRKGIYYIRYIDGEEKQTKQVILK